MQRPRVVRREREGPLERALRLGEPAQLEERDAALVGRVGIVGERGDRPVQVREREVAATEVVLGHPGDELEPGRERPVAVRPRRARAADRVLEPRLERVPGGGQPANVELGRAEEGLGILGIDGERARPGEPRLVDAVERPERLRAGDEGRDEPGPGPDRLVRAAERPLVVSAVERVLRLVREPRRGRLGLVREAPGQGCRLGRRAFLLRARAGCRRREEQQDRTHLTGRRELHAAAGEGSRASLPHAGPGGQPGASGPSRGASAPRAAVDTGGCRPIGTGIRRRARETIPQCVSSASPCSSRRSPRARTPPAPRRRRRRPTSRSRGSATSGTSASSRSAARTPRPTSASTGGSSSSRRRRRGRRAIRSS